MKEFYFIKSAVQSFALFVFVLFATGLNLVYGQGGLVPNTPLPSTPKTPLSTPLKNSKPYQELTGFQAEVVIPGAISIVRGKVSDVPQAIRLKQGAEIPYTEFANWFHKNLRLSADYDFKLMNEEKDTRVGYTHYRFQQTYKGIPVEGSMYILHVKDGKIYSMSGQIFSQLSINITPQLVETEALLKATTHVGAKRYAWETQNMESLKKEAEADGAATYYPKGQLVLVANNGNVSEDNFTLAYKFDIFSVEPYDRKFEYVDANDGHIASEVSRIENGDVPGTAHTQYSGKQSITCNLSGSVYSLSESGRGGGIVTYNWMHHSQNNDPTAYANFTSTTSEFSPGGVIDTGTDAHWGAEMVYDYYKKTFNRNSFDGNGLKIISMVHDTTGLQNADWNGTFMEYGDGCNGVWPFTDIVIVGHEMTHGFTQYTAGLVDANGLESGALNEGFSDIFGVSVQQYATGSTAWVTKFCGVNGRNLMNPTSITDPYDRLPFPDTYLVPGKWEPNGEVHHNSTVVSHWFYLLSQGGSGTNGIGNPYIVSGLGMSEAENIAYNTLSKYLTPTSGYFEARTFSIQAAIDIYGTGSQEVIQVTNAWFAVGVGDPYTGTYAVTGTSTGSEGYSIAHDTHGNNYVAGTFNNNLTLGSYNLTGPSNTTALFVAKFDSFGNVLWAVQGGGSKEADAAAIAVDQKGNAYVAGTFTGGGVIYGTGGTSQNFPLGTVFDKGDGEVEPVFDAVYMFVAMYDPTGKLDYCVKGGETNIQGGEVNGGYSGLIRATTIACGNDSSVYVGGIFTYGQTQLGSITLTNTASGGMFANTSFFAKCKGGSFSYWTGVMNSSSTNRPYGMVNDKNGNLYVTGYMSANSTYTDNSGDNIYGTITNPGDHPFVLKLSGSTGSPLLFDAVDGTGTGIAYGIAFNGLYKSVVITGSGSGNLNFDNLPITLSGSGGFVARLSLVTTKFYWVKPATGSPYGVATTENWSNPFNGCAFVTGTNFIQGFDLLTGNIVLTDNAQGTFQCNSLAVDSNSNILSATGYFSGGFTYGSQSLTAASGNQLLVDRFRIPTIRIQNNNQNQYVCYSDTFKIKFEADGNFYPGNVFTAQIDTATNGTFSHPISLGSVTSTTEFNTISCTLSPGVEKPGSECNIRIVSSLPADTGVSYYHIFPIANPTASITATPNSLCGNDSVELSTADVANASYFWYLNGTRLIGSGSNTLTAKTKGTYQVKVYYTNFPTNQSCFAAASKTLKGTEVIPNHSVTSVACDSSFVTLTATDTTGDTYSWAPSAGLNTINGSKVHANPTITTTYTVTATSASGCSGDTTIIVMPKPKLSVSTSKATIRCDSSLVLIASGSDSIYSWKPSTGLNSVTAATVTANPTVTTTYTVTAIFKGGCIKDTTVMVKVTKDSLTVNNITICKGTSGALTAKGEKNYAWAPPTGLSATSGATVTVNPTVTTTYTVTGSSSCGTTTATAVVTVKADSLAVNSISICKGSSGTLKASGDSAYQWAPSTGLSSVTGATVTANPTVTTTYTVSGISSCGTTTKTAVVTIKSDSVIVNSLSICKGTSGTLIASGDSLYAWAPSTGLSSVTGATVTANPTVTTTYTVTGTNSCGTTTATAAVIIKANLLTVSSISICKGTSGTLTAGGDSLYAWMPSTGLSASIGVTVTANPTVTTTYTVTGTNSCGTTTAKAIVTVTTTPTVSVNSITICSGSSGTLTASGASTYSWSPSAGLNVTTGASVTARPAATTSYTVTGISSCGTTSAISVVTITALPSVSVNSITICNGSSGTLTASGASTYSWAPSTGLSVTTGAAVTARPVVTTTYTVTGTTLCGTTTAKAVVTVNPLPAVVTATAGSSATTSQITANWNAASNATGYFLDVSVHSNFSSFSTGYDNLNVGNITSKVVTGLTPATIYYYRIRGSNNCGTANSSNTISFTTTTCSSLVGGTVTPVSAIICPGTTQLLTLTGQSGGTLQWQKSTDNISWTIVASGGNASTYTTNTADGAGNKYYRCVSSNACYSASSTSAIVDVSSPVITVNASGITDKTATLNWTPAGSGSYQLNYSGSSSGTLSSVTPPVTLTGLSSGGTYNVTVSQTTPAGCTATGTITGINTLCAAPTAWHVTASTSNSISVAWTGLTANYRVYYIQLFSSSVANYTIDVTNTTSATINSLLPGATYKIYVAQKDCPSAGILGQPSGYIYGTTTNATTCTAPTIDLVSSPCSGQIQITLHGSVSNLYRIYLQQLTPVLQPVNSYTITGGNFSINVAGAGQTYLIAAASVCGTSVSNLAIWQAGINVPATCNGVGNLLLSQPTCVGFTASWNADNCTTNTLNSYVLYLRKQGAISWNAQSVPSNTLFNVVSGLTLGTTYQSFIRSAYTCNGYVAYGPASQTQMITTLSSGCRVDDNQPEPTKPAVQQYSTDNQEVFSLYPNPNNGEFMIDLSRSGMEEDAVRIEVINMIGQTVITHFTTISGGHMNEFINLPNGTAAGTYIVRLTVGKNVYTAKINVSK